MFTKKYLHLLLGLVLIIGFFLTFSTTSFAQSVDDITFMTEIYPPFNFLDQGKLKGIAPDLLVLMLQKLNSQQTREDIQLLPWARGYRMVQKQPNTCLFSTTRTKERENLFKWVGPIASTTISLIARKEKQVKIHSIEDAKKYKIGVVRSDIGELLLTSAGIPAKQLDRVSGTSVIFKSIKKLNKGKIDVWSYEENVAKWEIKARGFDLKEYETVYTLKKGELYYAFHKETSDSLIQTLQNVLDQLKQQKDYQKILDSYLQ